MSEYDIAAIVHHYEKDWFQGFDDLPEEHQAVFLETIEKWEAIEPPKSSPLPTKTKNNKKSQVRPNSEKDTPKPDLKAEAEIKEENKAADDVGTNDAVEQGAVVPKDEDVVEKLEGVKEEDGAEGAVAIKEEDVRGAEGLRDIGNLGVGGVDENGIQGNTNSKSKTKTKTKAKRKAKGKGKSKKRSSEEMDDDSEEPEYVPRKTRSRAMPLV